MLAFFASELELVADVARWRAVETAYRDRTRQLFDSAAGRFRDRVRDAAEINYKQYWGIDPQRYSVQALTPLLIGEPLAEAEIMAYFAPPWTLWPSWTTTLAESAAAAGLFAAVGALAFETIERVYRVTTRRDLDELGRPLPGSAPEYWPLDWHTFDGSDAYGWGATTATLLIRHLFGFRESRQTHGWFADLVPCLPEVLCNPGMKYGIRHLNYRGLVFDLVYTVRLDGRLDVGLDLGQEARACSVYDRAARGDPLYSSSAATSRHHFVLPIDRVVTVHLQ